MRHCVAIAGVVVMCFGSAAVADIVYVSQSRVVDVSTRADQVSCSDSAGAPDFGAFDASRSCRSDEPLGGFSEATASMTCELRPDGIFAEGTCTGQWQRVGGSMGGYSCAGFNDLDIVFTVGASDYSLNLDYSIGDGPAPSLEWFTLTGPEGFAPIVFQTLRGSAKQSGAMPAGEYRLTAHVGRNASFPTIFIDTHLSLALTIEGADCRADFNNDGGADSQDFFDFLNAFFEGDPAADFNVDSTVDSQDFFDFVTAFFTGC